MRARRTGSCLLPFRFMRMIVLCMPVLLAALTSSESRAEIVLLDAAGRQVRLAASARRIVVNDSLLLITLALIDPDPVGKIAGWATPRRIDPGMFAAFRQRFPRIDAIPEAGAVVPTNVSPESIISTAPDLFVVGLWQPDWEPVVDMLTRAGVPVIFLDGPENAPRSPVETTAFSIELLGKAVGQADKAREYADFVRARYRRIEERLQGVDARPSVIIDAFAGVECCSTPGRNNRLTQTLELAGGKPVGVEAIGAYDGRLNPEAVLSLDPDVYIATGVARSPVEGGLALGSGLSAERARASLAAVVSQGIRRELSAVRKGRAFAVSHQISITALSVLTLECFAKWTHPALFADIDPAVTLAEINQRFLAVPLEGTFWIGLGDVADK